MKLIYIQSIIFLLFNYIVVSCTNPKVQETMDCAETLMEEQPDSAIVILSSVNKSELSGNQERARYAVLMSMALDKNYIDTTTFDVLQPAIDYYPKHGTPDDKLRTYYYQGVIFQNRGERENALNSYIKGFDISQGCCDSLTLARSLVAQARLYKDFYDFNSYSNLYSRAAEIYGHKNRQKLEFECLLNALNGAIILGDENRSDSLLSVCNSFPSLDDRQIDALKEYRLSYALKFRSIEDLRNIIQDYTPRLKPGGNNILNLAFAYNKIGDNETARQLLDALDAGKVGYDTTKYQYIHVFVLRDLEEYKDAFHASWDLSMRLDSINTAKFEQKSQTMEEKHQIELIAHEDARRKTIIIWGCVCGILFLTMGVVILFLLMRSNRIKKELAIQKLQMKDEENACLKSDKEILVRQVEALKNESEQLKTIIDGKEELPTEVQDAIKIRIEMLNSLLAGFISDSDRHEKPLETRVRELTENTAEFMNSNRLAFQVSHPDFVKYFEDHGLTVDEINYVCLYAIGLRGREVGNYIKKPGHVNTSSAIRKKLGIDKHETNIGIYVRKLLHSL